MASVYANVEIDLDDVDSIDLISELQDRGYEVYGKQSGVMFDMYQSYLLDDEKKFREHVKKLLIENGFHP
jgi:hypothetical protein